MAIKVTLDTNVVDNPLVQAAAARHGMEVAVVSVTAREVRDSSFEERVKHLAEVQETGVWGESEWGCAVWGSDWNAGLLGEILRILANGSFPRQGTALSKAQRRQLRDGMILEAHARESRNVFVSEDRKAFGAHGRRARLEALLRTKILTAEEFISEYGS